MYISGISKKREKERKENKLLVIIQLIIKVLLMSGENKMDTKGEKKRKYKMNEEWINYLLFIVKIKGKEKKDTWLNITWEKNKRNREKKQRKEKKTSLVKILWIRNNDYSKL